MRQKKLYARLNLTYENLYKKLENKEREKDEYKLAKMRENE